MMNSVIFWWMFHSVELLFIVNLPWWKFTQFIRIKETSSLFHKNIIFAFYYRQNFISELFPFSYFRRLVILINQSTNIIMDRVSLFQLEKFENQLSPRNKSFCWRYLYLKVSHSIQITLSTVSLFRSSSASEFSWNFCMNSTDRLYLEYWLTSKCFLYKIC